MFDFVNKMGTMDQVLFYMGFGATIFFLGQIVMMFIGGDSDTSDGDFGDTGDTDGDISSSFNLITLKNIVGFLMGLGWGGLALHVDGQLSTTMTLIFAPVIGVFVMLLQATVFWLMYKLHAPNTETLQNAVGNTGKVYLGIPDGGSGKVTVTVNGKLSTMDAVAENGKAIETQAEVVVVRVVNDELVVKQVN